MPLRIALSLFDHDIAAHENSRKYWSNDAPDTSQGLERYP
jgi:hypothetical protein